MKSMLFFQLAFLALKAYFLFGVCVCVCVCVSVCLCARARLERLHSIIVFHLERGRRKGPSKCEHMRTGGGRVT